MGSMPSSVRVSAAEPDLLAEHPGERRAAALDGVSAERPADEADEARGHHRVEDDGTGARGRLVAPSSDAARSPPSRPISSGSSACGRAAHAESQAGLLVAVGLGDRLQVRVGAGRLPGSARRRSRRRARRAPPRRRRRWSRRRRCARPPRGRRARPPARARSSARWSSLARLGSTRPSISGASPPRPPGGAVNSSGSAIRAASTAPAAMPRRPSSLSRCRRRSRSGGRSSSEHRARAARRR